MKSSQPTATPQESAVMEIIESGNALFCVVFDLNDSQFGQAPIVDYSWMDNNYVIPMQDTNKTRSSRTATFFQTQDPPQPVPTSVIKMNMRSQELSEHVLYSSQKGAIFHHTKKTATSYAPTDPRYMEYFQGDYGIILIWDKRTCDLKKEKYVFWKNAGTDNGFWFNLDSPKKIQALKDRLNAGLLATMDGLRKKNDQAVMDEKSIAWNEVDAGLPEMLLPGLAAPQDKRSVRLRTLRLMLHFKEKWGLKENIPLFVIQSFYAKDGEEKVPDRPGVYRVYTEEEQKADLAAEQLDLDAQKKAFDVINNHRALGLKIRDLASFTALVAQINDPTTDRPSRSADFFKRLGKPRPDTLTKMNLKTKALDTDFHPGQARTHKPPGYQYTHTVKQEMFLLPREPQWMDISQDDVSISLLFDSDQCDLKDGKYILAGKPEDERTDDCCWLDLDTPEKIAALQKRLQSDPIVTLDRLREINDNAQHERKVIPKNTVLAGAPKGQVSSLICRVSPTQDTFENRLKAYTMMLQIKQTLKLKLDIPIFVVQTGNNFFRLYNEIERDGDLVLDAWNKLSPEGLLRRQTQMLRMKSQHLKKEKEVEEDDFVLVDLPEYNR